LPLLIIRYFFTLRYDFLSFRYFNNIADGCRYMPVTPLLRL